jgi:hypothetical protein
MLTNRENAITSVKMGFKGATISAIQARRSASLMSLFDLQVVRPLDTNIFRRLVPDVPPV